MKQEYGINDKTLNYVYTFNRLDSVKSSEYVQPITYAYNTKKSGIAN